MKSGMASEVKSSKGPEIDTQWDPKLFSSRKSKKRSWFLAWIFVVFAIGAPIVSAENTGSHILNFRLQAIPKGDEVRYAGKILKNRKKYIFVQLNARGISSRFEYHIFTKIIK